MKVLHVVESFGGGVVTAIQEYISSVPEVEHGLLFGDRSQVSDDSWRGFSWTQSLPAGLRGISVIRRAVREFQPDVVHAHSSMAGAFTRLALNSRRVPIVYTPHCFAFERRDLSQGRRRVFKSLERVLSLNTGIIAGCSPYEAGYGERWLGPGRGVYVPNIARRPAISMPREVGGDPLVVGIGRLSIQKDPSWFAKMAAALPPGITVVWVGDGDEKYRKELEDAGVHVTGWIRRSEVLDLLGNAGCFVLSSLWEGFPMALLEALALDIPSVVRRMPVLPEFPETETYDDPVLAAGRVAEVLGGGPEAERCLTAWSEVTMQNTPAGQRAALCRVYGLNGDH